MNFDYGDILIGVIVFILVRFLGKNIADIYEDRNQFAYQNDIFGSYALSGLANYKLSGGELILYDKMLLYKKNICINKCEIHIPMDEIININKSKINIFGFFLFPHTITVATKKGRFIFRVDKPNIWVDKISDIINRIDQKNL